MRQKILTVTGLTMVLLLVTACGSTGDIFGGGSDDSNRTETLRGVVDYVDVNNRSIHLTNVSGGYSSMLSNSGSGNSVRVYYDTGTSVEYNGQGYRPEDLERGDEVTVRVTQSGNQLTADAVTVTRDVSVGSSGSTTYPSGSYGSNIRGTVRYVDTGRRTIEVDRGSGNTVMVEYDTRTAVAYGGRGFNVADLERGDEVDIRVTDLGSGRLRADDVTVVRSVSDSGTWNGNSSSNMTTVRGTVRYVDTNRRTIELEQVSGISGFNTGAGTIVVSYGSNASVEISGRGYPVGNLERGDVIDVMVDRSGSAYMANRIMLVRDVRN